MVGYSSGSDHYDYFICLSSNSFDVRGAGGLGGAAVDVKRNDVKGSEPAPINGRGLMRPLKARMGVGPCKAHTGMP